MKDELINSVGGEARSLNNKNKYIILSILSIVIAVLIIFQIIRLGGNNEIKTQKFLTLTEQECDSKHYLVDAEYKPYSFMATYFNENKDEEMQLINRMYRTYIKKYIYNSSIDIATSYTFSSKGKHEIYFDIDKSSSESLASMFNKSRKHDFN